jgi:hypothetical protein
VNDGIFLNVDTAAKFINKTTILETIVQQQYNRGFKKDEIAARFDSSNVDAQRVTVITSHNSKSY